MSRKIMMFSAPWCAGCKTLKPFLEKVEGKVEVEIIDVEEHLEAAEAYGISNLPTLFFVLDGEFVNHYTGSSTRVVNEINRFAAEQ